MENLKKKVAVNNQNKCERFRKKWHKKENKVPQHLIKNRQENQLYMNQEMEGGQDIDWVVL